MEDKLTYQELIDRLVESTGESKTALHSFIQKFVEVISEGLEQDKKCRVSKFGIFELHDIPATSGTNPRTGEPIKIAAHQRVAFKANATLETLVNKEFEHLESSPVPRVAESTIVSAPSEPKPPIPAAAPTVVEKRKFGFVYAALVSAVLIAGYVAVNQLGLLDMGENDATSMESASDPGADKLLGNDEAGSDDAVGAVHFELLDSVDQPALTPVIDPTKFEEIRAQIVQDVAEIEPATTGSSALTAEPEPKADGPASATGKPGLHEPSATGKQHLVVDAEGLWKLAEKYYDEPLFWVNIYRVNSARLRDPERLAKGMVIGIPDLIGTASDLDPEDSANIAEGAYQDHLAYKLTGSEHADYYLRMSYRYRPQEPIPASPADPVPHPAVAKPMIMDSLTVDTQYMVTNNDGLWKLAEKYYGEPLFWVNIYRVNSERVFDPDGLAKGMAIGIPQLIGTADQLAPEDSVNIAEGAYKVHLAYKRSGSEYADYYLRMSNRYGQAAGLLLGEE